MGLKAVANPAAGGQPGSFTSLTATSLTVNGLSTMTANSASDVLTVTQSGAGYSARFNGLVYAVNGLIVNGDIAGWANNGTVKIGFTGAGGIQFIPETGQNVQFGAYVAGAATDSTGYIEIKDAGGTIRKLMVQA